MMAAKCFRRVVLIVLDGVGVGALPDAADYGDQGAATLPHVARVVGGLNLPNLQRLGLGNICPIKGVPAQERPKASWGRMACKSAGKDSVTGHWELAGVIKTKPFACFPQGFPTEIIQKFALLAGCEPLGNIVSSGTDILYQLGEDHLQSKRPIVYTSSDSVFQIAAHEDIIPPTELYRLCEASLQMLRPYGLCRVIARPFIGDNAANFKRTSKRHDFPVEPHEETLLDHLQSHRIFTCGVGKIGDLFAGRGLDRSVPTRCNAEGLKVLLATLEKQGEGLIFVNLVDFDMLYGHRLDPAGFYTGLKEFDLALPTLLERLGDDDLLLITADHGCDPTTPGTDHCREYVPLLAWSRRLVQGRLLGARESFADVTATLVENFGLGRSKTGSFLSELLG
ncbi:MAG: phosphopentomutase [Geopsychrobacter sp.]|nr:phosphopentomutase [Geopsychrobacter sp.]